MELCGNKDNISVQNGATVALNYATKTLTGTGTTFGTTGYGVEGDVIRIGYTTSVIGAGGMGVQCLEMLPEMVRLVAGIATIVYFVYKIALIRKELKG